MNDYGYDKEDNLNRWEK